MGKFRGLGFLVTDDEPRDEATHTKGLSEENLLQEEIRGGEAARELSALLGPGVAVTSGPAFEDACRLWNGAVKRRPALVVRARAATDVQAAVRVARAHGLPLSVRAGGHDWAGRGLRHGGLVIDLSRMRQVDVYTDAALAIVGGGAKAADVIDAAPYGWTAVTGTTGSVGMAGLTLGGGYGFLGGRFGLAADNLLGADVVLADGRQITVDANNESDLFWALRGGGGNFGIVTSLRIRIHAVAKVLAGMIAYPLEQAGKALERLAEILAAAPAGLTVEAVILTGHDGVPALFIVPAWSGNLTAGQAYIEELQRLGTPTFVKVGPMTCGDLLHMNDALGEFTGRHVTARTHWLPGFSSDVIAAVVEASNTLTSPYSSLVIHHAHGAMSRVPVQDSAFGLRQDHLLAEIVGCWEPGESGPHESWADAISAALSTEALPGGYPNMLGPDDHAQIADAYGPNTARLLSVKARFDPDGVFSATPLPPAVPQTQ